MSETETVAFFAGAVRNCIEESQLHKEELASAGPMNKQMVVSLDQRVKTTHDVYISSIGRLPEVERTEMEHVYKAIRRQLLEGMMARYKTIICPAKSIVTEGTQPLAPTAGSTEPEGDQLELYASDDDEETPITRMSLLQCPENYKPITFTSERRVSKKVNPFSRDREGCGIENRRKEFSWAQKEERRASAKENRRTHDLQSSPRAIRTTQGGSNAIRDRNAKRPYVWAKQTPACGSVWGVPYPPMAHTQPMTVELKRNDPEIIGMAEIWTQKVGTRDAKKCAHCQFQENHRMYGCTILQKESIQRRWYHALKCGVCLNCLMIGHSSFTCKDQGCCKVHGTRHSTFLCERSFNNQL